MSAPKTASTSAVVGRRLRRSLGALLALGFGVAWWSFEPSATVEAAVPVIAGTASPVKLAGSPLHVAAVAMITPPARPAARRVKPRRPVIHPRPRRVDPEPTPTSLVIEMPPVIEPPVIEPPPVAEDPIDLTPIRTRSS